MKKYLLIVMVALVALNSCKGFLDEAPIMSQSTELTLSDYNGLNKSVAGAYSPLVSGVWYGAFLVLDSEMRAGNAMVPANTNFTSGRMLVPYNMTYEENSTSGLWTTAYYLISAVNNVINVIDNKSAEELGADEADINNLKAEALALRALAHFDLLRIYARTDLKTNKELGVPVITTPQLPTDMPARATVDEVFAQVISDLTDAESLMADGYKRSGVTDSFAVIGKDAIRALLSRVYLYHKDYQKAADYATKVINSGNYKLWTKAEYPAVWGQETASKGGEIIFEVYGKTANSYDQYWEGPSHMTNPKGYADCAASLQLTDLFEDGDVRGTKGVRGEGDGKVMFATDEDEVSGQLWTMKYFGKGDGDATSIPDCNNTVVLRLSEMYLIRAEAIVNGASVSGATALSDLNAIREARGASAVSAAGAAAIAAERRLELNFEGHYWFDLARTGGSVNYSDVTLTRNIDATSKYWALPIPRSQIEIDENLVQNPGY